MIVLIDFRGECKGTELAFGKTAGSSKEALKRIARIAASLC